MKGKMQSLWPKIQKRLFSGNRYLQKRDSVETTAVTGRGNQWVISRECCIYRRLDLSHIPASRQRDAVARQIPLISPFVATGYWVSWHKGVASVWLWDRSRQEALKKNLPAADALQHLGIYPESAFTDPSAEGGRVWKSADGYIGQYWHDGGLAGEMWWQHCPSQSEWNDFLSSISRLPEEKPETTPLDPGNRNPWRGGGRSDSYVSETNERLLVKGVAVVLALVITFQALGIARLYWHIGRLEEEISELTPTVEKSVALRDEYYDLRSRNLHYQSLAGPGQLQMMSDIAGALAGVNASFLEWSWRNDSIEVVVHDPVPDLAAYVRQLESLGWLDDIRVDTRPRKEQIVIRGNRKATP